jgi:hypothetical protein
MPAFLYKIGRAVRMFQRDGAALLADRLALEASRRRLRKGALQHLLFSADDGRAIGMTSLDERAYLRGFAERDYDGDGEIVDLGCWLGSSTLPLARGVARNPRVANKRGRVHAFDRFVWEEWMHDHLPVDLAEGASFRPEFERLIAEVADQVTVHAADLSRVGWEERRPIALLFHDAAKSWELENHVRGSFFPWLVPGKSLLVDQDFAHWFTPWVHLVRHRMRDALEPILHVPASGSFVFRLVAPIPEAMLAPLTVDDFPGAEIDAAFEWALGLVKAPLGANVWAARVKLEIDRGRFDAARDRLEDGERRGLKGLDLRRVAKFLAESAAA